MKWVDLKLIFGTDKVPVDAAIVMLEAIKKAQEQGLVGSRNKWQFVEWLMDDYLAGK